ncbi:MAG: ribosomal protein S18-alanine N-acetyltransferase [Desulfosarcina sp.]
MGLDDIEAVLEIERASFDSPWSRAFFVEELGRDWARLEALCPAPGVGPVAFINYWVVRDEIHILKVATHPAHRRRGFGTQLLSRAMSQAPGLGIRYVTLEVRRSNEAAIALYRRFGFEPIGIRPRYYEESKEDAIVMLLTFQREAS